VRRAAVSEQEQEQVRFDVLASLIRKGRTFHDPSLRLASMVRALNSINCRRNEQKARSIAGETHNRKPFHPKFM
jgi:hypothetical protein